MENNVTYFAPIEKLEYSEIIKQYNKIKNINYFNTLINLIPNITLILNKYRQIVFFNNSLDNKEYNIKLEDVLGKRPGEVLNCIHALDNNYCGCGTTKFCKSCGAVNAILNSAIGKFDTQECSILRKKDNYIEAIEFKVYSKPIEVDNENFIFFSLIDISDTKRKRIMEKIFFHDILNTVSALKGYTEYLVETDKIADIKKISNEINNIANSLIDEIKSQRDLILAEHNELKVNNTKIILFDFLNSVINQFKNQTISKNKNLVISSDIENFYFISDNVILGRVIKNMIKNGLEASNENDTVEIGVKIVSEQIEFWVTNPAYIPEDIQLQIFKRSFSTKDYNRGLGTYSMRLFTEVYLKGTIGFTSSKENGTRFFIRIPYIK